MVRDPGANYSRGPDSLLSIALLISSLVRSQLLSDAMILGSLASAPPRSPRLDAGTCSNSFASFHPNGDSGIFLSWISMYRPRSPLVAVLKTRHALISRRPILSPQTKTVSSVIFKFGTFLNRIQMKIKPFNANNTPFVIQSPSPPSTGKRTRMIIVLAVSTVGKTLVSRI